MIENLACSVACINSITDNLNSHDATEQTHGLVVRVVD